jgi:hypothetical protein
MGWNLRSSPPRAGESLREWGEGQEGGAPHGAHSYPGAYGARG